MFKLKNISMFRSLQKRFSSHSVLSFLEMKDQGYFKELLPIKSEPYLKVILNNEKQHTLYCGFDPTAESLQLGNLVALMGLLRCHRAGHNIIALIGGATGRIGDPTGKTSDRSVLHSDRISNNVASLSNNLEQILSNNHTAALKEGCGSHTAPGTWKILNNAEWFDEMGVIDFVSTVGHHLRLRDIMGRESIKQRMQSGAGMNIKEFLYPLFQAYDWWHLFKAYGCRFQIGGNDQQGNIDTGQLIIQRAMGQDVFGLTVPLLTQKGRKVGKSDAGSKKQATGQLIWLDHRKTSPYSFYQYLYGTQDTEVNEMLKMFTFLTPEKLQAVMARHETNPEDRYAQKMLASMTTQLVHGEIGLLVAEAATRIFFSSNPESRSKDDVNILLDNPGLSPVIKLENNFSKNGLTLCDLVIRSGNFKTVELATDAILKGSVRLNGTRVTDPSYILNSEFLQSTPFLKVGKQYGWIISTKSRKHKTSFS